MGIGQSKLEIRVEELQNENDRLVHALAVSRTATDATRDALATGKLDLDAARADLEAALVVHASLERTKGAVDAELAGLQAKHAELQTTLAACKADSIDTIAFTNAMYDTKIATLTNTIGLMRADVYKYKNALKSELLKLTTLAEDDDDDPDVEF
jgi:chromosome segregation ATPase